MEYSMKIILLGESAVGKTSLIQRYHKGEFNNRKKSTKKVYFIEKVIRVDLDVIKAHIWDTAGQNRFHSMQSIYYKGANAALLVYALNDYDSFIKVKDWVGELLKFCPDILLTIVGAKCDLQRQITVKKEEVDEYCKSINNKESYSGNCEHIITSSKANKNVDKCFFETMKRVLKTQKLIGNINNKKRTKKSKSKIRLASNGYYQLSSYDSQFNKRNLAIDETEGFYGTYKEKSKCFQCCVIQ